MIGKGGKQRTASLTPPGVPLVERWLEVRKRLGLHHSRPVFCTLEGEPLSAGYARAMLKRYAGRAGIEKRVHPHGLRHAHAHTLLDKGANVRDLQHQLGHSSLGTTGQYVDSIAPVARIRRINELGW